MPKFPGRLALLLLTRFLAGCDGAPPPAGPEPRTESPDTASRVRSVQQPVPAAPSACGVSKGSIPASDPCIRYMGRFNFADPLAPAFSWPGVVIEARFQGPSVKARLGSLGGYFDVFIDGAQVFPPGKPAMGKASLLVESTGAEFLLASGLSSGEHSLRIEKRSETNWGVSEFQGLVLEPGMALVPMADRSGRRIEFIGDSYTVGFGNESPSKTSPGKQDESGRTCSDPELGAFTNTQVTYAVLAAKTLGAEYQVNAFSGLGMARHYSGSTAFKPFQDYYKKILQSEPLSPDYDPAGWIPGVVVIALGTNDFSTPLGVGEPYADRPALYAAYQQKYREFLGMLRGRYAGVKLILLATNLWPEDEMKAQVKKVVDGEIAAGRADVSYFEFINTTGFGCAWHPDAATHLAGSRNLARKITEVSGWQPQGTSIRR